MNTLTQNPIVARRHLLALCCLAFSLQSVAAEAPWKEVAGGVYERTDADGSTTRMAYGSSGAEYDMHKLTEEAHRIEARMAKGAASTTDDRALEEIRGTIADIQRQVGGPAPMASDTGSLCNQFTYYFDSHFVVGKVGATPVARVAFNPRAAAPLFPYTDITLYTKATLTPAGGSTITDVSSGSFSGGVYGPLDASIDWLQAQTAGNNLTPVTTASCSAGTFSYIQVTPTCSVGVAYVSQTKTYSTCASSL